MSEPNFDGLLQGRQTKAVVHGEQCAGIVGDVGNARMSQISASGLVGVRRTKAVVFGLDGGFPFARHPFGRQRNYRTPNLRELGADQLDGRAEHRARAHHMVARFQQAHAQKEDGAHAAGGGDGSIRMPSSAARRFSMLAVVGLVKRE